MTYYKAFKTDLTCRGYKFEIGKTYTIKGELEMCKNGFHCCSEPLKCLQYYTMPLRLCEVSIGDESMYDNNKRVTSQITIVREIVGEEFNNLLTGMAIVDGCEHWYKEGLRHRDADLPAVTMKDGRQYWYKFGECHRENDMPALIHPDGSEQWYRNGQMHRDGDQPAVIFNGGDLHWYRDNRRHRDENKPAIVCKDGSKFWYRDGVKYSFQFYQ